MTDDEPVLEGGRFDEASLLGRVLGDRPLAALVVAAFLEDAPRQLEALGAPLCERDGPALARRGHALKGAAAAVGADRVTTLAERLEQHARAGRLDAARRTIEALTRELAAFEGEARASGLLSALT